MGKYLSIDCGGTKTAFLLCDENGKELASCVEGPGNYMVSGIGEVVSVLKSGIEKVCEQAQIAREEIAQSFIAIAGFGDVPDDIPWITKLVREELSPIPVTPGNDTENALAGALLGKHGIHVIAGTGSIGLGYDENGEYIRSGGWHHLFGGDEGSGYWLGSNLILRFTRQADGREEKSELYSYLMEKYQLGRPENILDLVITQWKGERDKIASMSTDVYELAERGDSNAIEIFKRAAGEHAAIVRSIYERGTFTGQIPVSYSGGVFKAMKYLRSSLEEALAGIPHVLTEPQLLPVQGGIVLAMKADGRDIDETVVANLRDSQS